MVQASSDMRCGADGCELPGADSGGGEILVDGEITIRRMNSAIDVEELNYKPMTESIADGPIFGLSAKPPERRRSGEQKRASYAARVRQDLLDRQHLSRNLHDHAGQYLVSIMFQLAALERRVGDDATRNQVLELSTTVARFHDELRALCAGRGLALPTDIVTALNDLSRTWARQVGIAVKFEHSEGGFDDLGNEVVEAMFRITQEALTNVAKHAVQATHVSLRLHRDDTHIRLSVEDNGVVESAGEMIQVVSGSPGGCGLPGMHERVRELGGQFTMEQIVGTGTRISATFPIAVRGHLVSSIVQ